MPRKRRIDYPGSYHHVMNRGARRETIFHDESYYLDFLDILAQLPERFEIRIHAYALMPNHNHLLVESVHGNLADAMRMLDGEFGRRFNARQEFDGPVWRGRYKNCVVEEDEYWRYLFAYVHGNRVRAGMSETLDASPWTSHPYYSGRVEPPDWLTVDGLEPHFGSHAGYRRWVERCITGTEAAPEGFDESRLYGPNNTGVMRRRPQLQHNELEHVLARVAVVTRTPLADLGTTQMGRHGNLPGCVACWWAAEATVATQGDIARALGLSLQAVSKRISRVRRLLGRDETVDAWVGALLKGAELATASK